MKNLKYDWFKGHGSICENHVQYAFLTKQMIPDKCGFRMVQNMYSDATVSNTTRVLKVMKASVDNDVTERFAYDASFGTGSYVFLFKVSIYGYVMFTCDSRELLEEAVCGKQDVLAEGITSVFEEFNKIMVRG